MYPKKIIVMRHAESQEDIDQTVYAHTADHDVELSSLGKEQAVRVGEILGKIINTGHVHFYLSPGVRLLQTYELVNATFSEQISSSFSIESQIAKQFWGDLTVENRREIEIARYREGILRYRFPNGESGTEFVERIRAFINDLRHKFLEDDYPETIVILTHGFAMRVFLMQWFDWTVEFLESLANPRNCEFIELLYRSDGQYVLKQKMRIYDAANNPNFIKPNH